MARVHFALTAAQEAAATRHELLPRNPLRRLQGDTEDKEVEEDGPSTSITPAPTPSSYMTWLVAALVLAALVLSVGGYLWLRRNAKTRITTLTPAPTVKST